MALLSRMTKTFLPYVLALSCGSNHSDYVTHEIQRTNRAGDVIFDTISAAVRNESGEGIEDITVHYLTKDNRRMLLAIGSRGAYFPEKISFLEEGSPPAGVLRSSLQQSINLVLERATQVRKQTDAIREVVEQYQPGELLESSNDVNKYCMTPEQIEASTIDVPAGLIMLAGANSNVLSDGALTLLKSAVTMPLRDLLHQYLVENYGDSPGYEVWVPKTAMSICGESREIVCTLDENQLSRIWGTDLPYWKINGACQQQPQSDNCVSHYRCQQNLVYRENDCGIRELVQDCGEKRCREGVCQGNNNNDNDQEICAGNIGSLLSLCRDYYQRLFVDCAAEAAIDAAQNAQETVCTDTKNNRSFLQSECLRVQCAEKTNCDEFDQCVLDTR